MTLTRHYNNLVQVGKCDYPSVNILNWFSTHTHTPGTAAKETPKFSVILVMLPNFAERRYTVCDRDNRGERHSYQDTQRGLRLSSALMDDADNNNNNHTNDNVLLGTSLKATAPEMWPCQESKAVPGPLSTRRRTRFSTSSPLVHQVEPWDAERRGDLWYSSNELLRLNRNDLCDARDAAKQLLPDNDDDNDDCKFCHRGLEDSLTIRGRQTRQSAIVSVVQAVLDGQRIQKRKRTTPREEYLRLASETFSRRSKEIALERAESDARIASQWQLRQLH